MNYLDKQRFDYEDRQRYDEPEKTIIYLVVTDDTEVVFSSDFDIQAVDSYNTAVKDMVLAIADYTKVELREIDAADFKNGKDKHNIQNSTLIEFKEL